MSGLALQLAALRKQAGAPAATAPPSIFSSPTSSFPSSSSPIPDELRRLLGIRARTPVRVPSADRELPGFEVADGVHLLERVYRSDSQVGSIDSRFATTQHRRAFGVVPRSQLLHFDTETTGLAGGTGTRAFMIGVAGWKEGALHVRQLFLTVMAGEQAMLELFASWLDPQLVLVSYNGRSYDAPLLATRFRLARLANPLNGLRHLDLLYPVRRRFRRVWENCRLATVEREWLDVVRDDDLPGSEAPRAWRDYLRGGSARDLRRVLAHNERDLLSLDTLLVKLSEDREPLLAALQDPPAMSLSA